MNSGKIPRKWNCNSCENCGGDSWTLCKTCQDNARFIQKCRKKLESLDKQYSKQPSLRLKYQISILWGLLN